MKKLVVSGIAVIAILAVVAVAVFVMTGTQHLEPPRREGPPALVMQGSKPHLWLLVKQAEYRQIGSRSSGMRREIRHHFEIHCHDATTTAVIWRRRLLTLRDSEGGHNAQARIFGQDGEVVWLYLNDQPLAVAAADGAMLADRARLEAQTPALKGLIPAELRFFAYESGLIVTTADARRLRIRAPDYAASAYQPPSEDAFQRLSYMAQQWNGGYQTQDFLVRQALFGRSWIGLHTPAEAADAGQDEFGDKFKTPANVKNDGAMARRALWTATIGKTREFSEGRHDRLTDVVRLPGSSAEFLQGAFLVKAGTRAPLALGEPGGTLILHRTRVDAEGRLALTRVDPGFATAWSATLPFTELNNRWELPGRLLLYGAVAFVEAGISRHHELLVAVDLRDGRLQSWNVTLDEAPPSR